MRMFRHGLSLFLLKRLSVFVSSSFVFPGAMRRETWCSLSREFLLFWTVLLSQSLSGSLIHREHTIARACVCDFDSFLLLPFLSFLLLVSSFCYDSAHHWMVTTETKGHQSEQKGRSSMCQTQGNRGLRLYSQTHIHRHIFMWFPSGYMIPLFLHHKLRFSPLPSFPSHALWLCSWHVLFLLSLFSDSCFLFMLFRYQKPNPRCSYDCVTEHTCHLLSLSFSSLVVFELRKRRMEWWKLSEKSCCTVCGGKRVNRSGRVKWSVSFLSLEYTPPRVTTHTYT